MNAENHQIWDLRFVNMIMDSMAEGVFTMDSQGRVTSWNRAMEKISGYKSEEALGMTCQMLQFDQCVQQGCPTNFKDCGVRKYKKGVSKECALRHKNGHDVAVIKNARPVFNEQGVMEGIVETITDLTEIKRAREEAEEAARRLGEMHEFGNIVGKSQGMMEVFTAIKAAAASDVTVLVTGESGTGKELVAGAIHYHSSRSTGPMVTVNCSALSETLLESELFGHVKGAFTGAIRDRVGRFEQAMDGTIFLDEIAELTPAVQVRLLRVLQEREIERVGESISRKINIRVIAATHKNLLSLVEEGVFRQDLYYRLKVFPIHIPPLRERRRDIPLLVDHFRLEENAKTGKNLEGVADKAMRKLLEYSWPGNVRELENAVEHAFVLRSSGKIDLDDLPYEIRREAASEPLPWSDDGPKFRGAITKERLLEALEQSGWNKAEAGRRLGKSRTSIWKYMKKWDIPLRVEEG
ncbi:PAS modulated sigma54 specific transcriptional regulator, Fis family [Desulfatibacillum aliphaticivorans]|uniref:PAS modulated sigma54 specific transcriptional regulator, Fis family n=1 Tax=Desulfatibacillum aliphaticivorans TaxID=218208 RepID=B8F936_DESAL|nr:sigma 54-interacting transcriptional regulator [Desulfatibacillum aliphaticivorans]ACL02782.1 PAS modulated sigma54 specific transcriptional regulator, Fis family [Desulfatibacillum aliphaticivorans]